MISPAASLRGFWPRLILGWAAVSLLLVLRSWPSIQAFELGDPDDVLRLVQVRDLLAGQGWFELHQYRIDPPHGVPTHWSRLVDIPLVALMLVLTPLIGAANAEVVTAIAVPLLTLLCAMLLTGRIALRLFGPAAGYATCLTWIMALPAIAQLQPMRIDHHGWQIVAVLAAINGALSQSPRKGGWLIGAALAAGLAISLELLPFTVLFAALLGWRWLRDPRQAAGLVAMLQALAVVSVLSYLLTRGPGAIENHCDTVSPAYLGGFVIAAGLVSLLALRPPPAPIWLAVLLAMAAGVTGAAYLALAPQCLTGPFAALDPVVREVWYRNVLEGMPVWHLSAGGIAQALVPTLTGLGILVLLWRRAADDQRAKLADLALLLGGAIAIGAVVLRFSGVATAIATVPLGWLVASWWSSSENLRLPARLAALVAAPLLLLPGFFIEKAGALLPKQQINASAAGVKEVGRGCGLPGSRSVLAGLPKGTIFAPFEVSPTILLHTHHSVVATGHHRASAAMRDVIDGFSFAPAQAEGVVRGHEASFVIACADLIEAQNYRDRAPKGLMADLLAGKPPVWLEPVALPAQAGSLKVWRVLPAATAAPR
jgi:hypothetical protein